MKFIKVAHSLNKTYNVEDVALVQAIKKAIANKGDAKLENIVLEINSSSTSFKVRLEINKTNNTKYSSFIQAIENDINEYSINLIGTKPDNIQIIVN